MSSGRSCLPALMRSRKSLHALTLKKSLGPSGSLLSRTAMTRSPWASLDTTHLSSPVGLTTSCAPTAVRHDSNVAGLDRTQLIVANSGRPGISEYSAACDQRRLERRIPHHPRV